MKRFYLYVIFLILPLLAKSQSVNLVPNFGFETLSQCPNITGELFYALPWYSPTAGTPDYYNICYPGSFNSLSVDVPLNWIGYQQAHSGNAYAGFASRWNGPNQREYIEVQLSDTLIANKSYCVSFYVSLADSSNLGISPIGAYFSDTLINVQLIGSDLPLIPQINSAIQTPLDDTASWMLISGSFVAVGRELYLIIGTFASDNELNVDTVRSSPDLHAYYYIDDVSVIEIAPAIAGNNLSFCIGDSVQLGSPAIDEVYYSWQPTTGLNNSSISNPKASPLTTTTYTLTQTQCDVVSSSTVTVTLKNDCSMGAIFLPTLLKGDERLYVQGLESNSMLEIFDARGRRIYFSSDYENDFCAFNLAEGIYFVRLTQPNGNTVRQKLCILR